MTKKQEKPDKSIIFVNVPAKTHRELKRLAYEKNTTLTSIVNGIIDEHIKNNPPK
jgi:hypothetical protein